MNSIRPAGRANLLKKSSGGKLVSHQTPKRRESGARLASSPGRFFL